MPSLILGCCPAIAEDGTIYIGAWDHCLHAVNPDGTRKWKFDTDDEIVSSPAIGSDGTIYFGTMAGAGTIGKIFAINPNGTEKWQYSTGYDVCSDPAIGDDGTIYIGSSDDYLYAMYPNGTLRWRYKTGDWVRGPVSIADDGTVYVGSYDGYLYALYPNGALRWKTEIWYGSDTNPTIGTDGTIYISSASKLFAINLENGDIIWEFNLGGDSGRSSPAICADGIIYIGIEIGDRDGGEIVAINSNGTEHWRQRISNYDADSSPAIGSDGTIYICSTSGVGSGDSGHLHAFGTSDPNAPEAPSIDGETNGETGVEYEYTFSSNDPNNNDVYYYIEWGDGEFEDWFGPFASGVVVTVSHSWSSEDTYSILAKAKDEHGAESDWSDPFIITIVENDPPGAPVITGTTNGAAGTSYDYGFASIDPDGDDIAEYIVDWGDGTGEETITGPFASGEEVTASHLWTEKDTYTIKAKAKDIYDAEGDWGYLEVTMPMYKAFNFFLIQWLFERFSNVFPIFRYILGR